MTIQDAIDRLDVLCVLDAPSLRTAVDMAKDALREVDALGGLDRLRELVQADREGRCVVLPCKVGDPVYMATGRSRITGYEEDICDGFLSTGPENCKLRPKITQGITGPMEAWKMGACS